MDRKTELLRAVLSLLKSQYESFEVLDVMAQPVYYDGDMYDAYTLMLDIEDCLIDDENKEHNHGCDCCQGDEALYYKDSENNAFVDSKGDVLVTVKGKTMRYKVKCCPNCGKEF